jgi:hypothetical protein
VDTSGDESESGSAGSLEGFVVGDDEPMRWEDEQGSSGTAVEDAEAEGPVRRRRAGVRRRRCVAASSDEEAESVRGETDEVSGGGWRKKKRRVSRCGACGRGDSDAERGLLRIAELMAEASKIAIDLARRAAEEKDRAR